MAPRISGQNHCKVVEFPLSVSVPKEDLDIKPKAPPNIEVCPERLGVM